MKAHGGAAVWPQHLAQLFDPLENIADGRSLARELPLSALDRGGDLDDGLGRGGGLGLYVMSSRISVVVKVRARARFS